MTRCIGLNICRNAGGSVLIFGTITARRKMSFVRKLKAKVSCGMGISLILKVCCGEGVNKIPDFFNKIGPDWLLIRAFEL